MSQLRFSMQSMHVASLQIGDGLIDLVIFAVETLGRFKRNAGRVRKKSRQFRTKHYISVSSYSTTQDVHWSCSEIGESGPACCCRCSRPPPADCAARPISRILLPTASFRLSNAPCSSCNRCKGIQWQERAAIGRFQSYNSLFGVRR